MRRLREYKFYFRAFQVLAFFNVLLIIVGISAAIHFVRTHNVEVLNLVWIGIAAVLLGVVLPLAILKYFFSFLKELQFQTEERVKAWVGGWLDNYCAASGRPLKDPYFWLNTILLSVEMLAQDSKSAVTRYFAEFSSIVRREIIRHEGASAVKKRRSRGRSSSKAGSEKVPEES